ncbi:MAG: tetratricopeptide repeat protein [Chloroflexaceae bacterium]|nr:tetratricopeptide repeat protein [Chloroflexaceae bacterium]
MGNAAAAEEAVDRALEQRSTYADAWFFRARLLQAQGELDAAYDAYNRAIEGNRRFAAAYYQRGLIAMSRNDYGQAQNDLERATLLEPQNAEAFYWLGRANLALERTQPALLNFERSVTLSGGNLAVARLYQGIAEERLGRTTEAEASYETVIQTSRDPLVADRARTELERFRQDIEMGAPVEFEQ